MEKFYFAVTDTFCGEANYAWCRKYTIEAKSELGAIQKLARLTGIKWRKQWDAGDCARYDAKGAAICVFLNFGDEN